MKTSKKISELSPSANASPAGSLNLLGAGNAMKWWEERDTRLMPFFNLYTLVVQYQIHHGMSDEHLANDLGRSPHTVKAWREAITIESVLRGLIVEIERKYGKRKEIAWPIFMRRLKNNLKIRQKKIRALRKRIPQHRSDSGLPSGIFPLPTPDFVQREYKGLLRPLNFAVTGGERSTPSADRLKALVYRLNWASSMEPPKDPTVLREKIMERLGVAGALRTQLSFKREFFPEDSEKEISVELTLAIDDLKKLANNYSYAVMLRSCNGLMWWESISLSDLKKDETFSTPPQSFKTPDSLPETAKKLASEFLEKIDRFISALDAKGVSGGGSPQLGR